jgi:hypothetical protein
MARPHFSAMLDIKSSNRLSIRKFSFKGQFTSSRKKKNTSRKCQILSAYAWIMKEKSVGLLGETIALFRSVRKKVFGRFDLLIAVNI